MHKIVIIRHYDVNDPSFKGAYELDIQLNDVTVFRESNIGSRAESVLKGFLLGIDKTVSYNSFVEKNVNDLKF